MKMTNQNLDDLKIANILNSVKTIAMVGVSKNWKRPSNFAMKYLQKNGYKIIPVNPKEAGNYILGQLCYANLEEILVEIDMVNVFRKSNECFAIAKEAIKIKPNVFWMQIGVINDKAIKLVEKNGITAVYNRCPKIEHSRIFGSLGSGGFYSKLISSKKQDFTSKNIKGRDSGFFQTKNLETLAVHAGTFPDNSTGARSFPIYQTASFTFDDGDHAAGLYNLQEPGNIYGRLSNPTTAALEQRIASLDDAIGSCCVSSGHAAQLVALYPLLGPGKKIVASSKLYGGSITQFTKTFKNFGWEAQLVDINNLEEVNKAVSSKNVRALFAESLANPEGNICDISKLSKIAHNNGIPLIIDNTMATQAVCKPGKFGADLILYSTTKFLSGHGNAMGGAIVDMGSFDWSCGREFDKLTSSDSSYHDINFHETFGNLSYINYCHACVLRDLGTTMSPFNAYLTLTGIETLKLRMQKHMSNASLVANFLKSHRNIDYVSWSGFKENPFFKLGKKYFDFGFGSVFTFSLKSGFEAGRKLVENCNLLSHLANVGDTKSLIIHPASTTHRQLTSMQRQIAGVGDSIIRISVGIEDANDIILDLEKALENIK